MERERQNRTAGRMDRLIHERVHDPYKTKSKLTEPTCARSATPSSKRADGNGLIPGQ